MLVRNVTPRARRPRLPAEMRRGHVTGRRSRDVSSDDEASSDVTGSGAVRRRDGDSDVPRFFYGRAAASSNDHRQPQTDDVSTPRVSRDTPVSGMSINQSTNQEIFKVAYVTSGITSGTRWPSGTVPDLRSRGRGFDSRPRLLCTNANSACTVIPPGSVNKYQRKLGSKRAHYAMH